MKSGIMKGIMPVFIVLGCLFFIFSFSTPSSHAHVLIIADGDSSNPELREEGDNTASTLKSKGYKVLKLSQKNATTKNIMKGMYKADAVIYIGHGGYASGNYNNKGGNATPPFALVGSNDFLWGSGDKIKSGWNGRAVKAPFKPGIPVILSHTCFSTGYVEDNEVSNPTETIYHFSRMFTGSGANYYASGYFAVYKGKVVVDMVDKFLGGATTFQAANQKNTGAQRITRSSTYNGTTIWRNSHGNNAFVGNWSATFPKASQTTYYDDLEAEAWYQAAVLVKPDKTAPTVKSTSPARNSKGIILTSPVTITFSEKVKAGGNVIAAYIKNLKTGAILSLSSRKVSGNTLILKAAKKLVLGSTYQIFIPAGAVKDGAGNTLVSNYTYNFKTTTDGTPPEVYRTSPRNKATGVSLAGPVTITFTENIKPGSRYSAIYIKNLSTGKKVKISTKTIKGKTLTLKMKSSRIRGNTYLVYIPASSVKDKSVNPLKKAYNFQFRAVK